MEHTPEPWFVFDNRHCVGGPCLDSDAGTGGVAMCAMRVRPSDEAAANARRIVACVNALAGIPTEQIEQAASQEGRARIEWLMKALVARES